LPKIAEPHPSYLGLCTPVADILAHSPPPPLVIDYHDHDITAGDEEAIILAFEQRERVRRIRLHIPVLNLVMTVDGECPILEYLILVDLAEEKRTILVPYFQKHFKHHIYAIWGSAILFQYTYSVPQLL